MKRLGRIGVVVLVLLVSVALDQATKMIAQEALRSASPVSLLNDFIRLEYAENPGAFMGLGATWPSTVRFVVLIIIAVLIVTILLSFTIRSRLLNTSQLIGMSLIVGGGVSNLIDRIFRQGLVVDFVSIGLPTIRTGVFNLADLLVVVGAVVLILCTPPEAEDRLVDQRYIEANTRIRKK